MIKGLLSLFKEPCSFWPNLWGKYDWSHCCNKHDADYNGFDYHYDSVAYRLMKDIELKECVNAVLPGMGDTMFIGVRLFGWFFYEGYMETILSLRLRWYGYKS